MSNRNYYCAIFGAHYHGTEDDTYTNSHAALQLFAKPWYAMLLGIYVFMLLGIYVCHAARDLCCHAARLLLGISAY